MNEDELKRKVNRLRHEIDRKDKNIRGLYKEINFHKSEADEWRLKRDKATEIVKTSGKGAKSCIEKRDIVNKEIASLKKRRESLTKSSREIRNSLKKEKNIRDELNTGSKGTHEMLRKIYYKDMDKLLNNDIELQKEILIFDNIFETGKRLNLAKKADNIHHCMLTEYKDLKNSNKDLDDIHEKIHALAGESQVNHESAMKIYKGVDSMRKESDKCHKKLLEKYDDLNPLRDSVTAIKGEIQEMRDELTPLMEQLEKIRAAREDQKKKKDVVEAKKKLEGNKRLNMSDFKILLDGGELKLKE